MDIRQLKYFLTIAEEEQITSAAKRLNMAQPPLSQQLKQLEKEFGVKLIERGSRKIQLTDAGKRLRQRAEQILELTDGTIRELKDFNEGLQGTLTVGTVSSSGATILPHRIKMFNEKYPGINFEILEGNTYRIIDILSSGLIEVGIVRTPLALENFNYIQLPKEPMVAVYSDDRFFQHKPQCITMEELRDKPIILYRRFEALILEECKKVSIEPRIFCKTDDARSALLWSNSGIGVGIVPKSAIKLLGDSNLSYVEIKNANLETNIAVIWMKNRYLSTATKHFINTFRE